jgi:hypothetical protein
MKKQASPAPVEIQTDSSMLEIYKVSTACYNLLSISHVNYYQTRLSRVQTSGVRGPPWTSAGWTARPSSGSWQPQPADGLDDRPSNRGTEWPSASSRPLLQSGGGRPPRPSGKGCPPCSTTALNIKKCVYKCLKWENYHFSSFFNPCHKSFQILFGWKQFISNREPK